MGASVGLVAGLLACGEVSMCSEYEFTAALTVVAKPLRGRAHLCVLVSRTFMVVSVRTAKDYATQELLPELPSYNSSSQQRPTAAPTSADAPSCLTSVVSNISALEARTTRKRRHLDVSFGCSGDVVSICGR